MMLLSNSRPAPNVAPVSAISALFAVSALFLATAPVALAQETRPAAKETRPAAKPPAPPEPPAIRIALTDLCHLSLQDGRLVFGTKMPLTGITARPVEVDGLPGSTLVSYRPMKFTLANEHETEDGRAVTLNIERRRPYFRLQRTVAGPAGEQSVVFTQSYVEDEAVPVRAGHVRLTVTSPGKPGSPSDAVESRDFHSLRREHPRPFYPGLVPALRDLGAAGLLAVDPWTARQALAEPVPPERLPAAVAALVTDLGDKSPKVRERASTALASLGADGAAELQKIDRKGLSPQQVTAIDVLLKRHQPLTRAEADRLRDDEHFLLDCLYNRERDVAPVALERLRRLTRGEMKELNDLQLDPKSPPAARAAAIEPIRARLTAEGAEEKE